MAKTLKVGLFVTVAILASVMIVFIIGDSRRAWDAKYDFEARFADVVGLKTGAPVRMGGLDIGLVTDVSHAGDPADPTIHVRLTISRKEAVRVREDSVARVTNKGLLGDKMIEITTGSPAKAALRPGALLKTEEPIDLSKYLAKFESIVNKTEQTVSNLEVATRSLGDPKVVGDLKGAIASLNLILTGIAERDGTAHRIVFDVEQGQKVNRLIGNMEGASRELHAASSDLRDLAGRVKSGPGLAHALVYDDKLADDLRGTAHEVRGSLEAVRTGKGLAHGIVYGDPATDAMVVNLASSLSDVRQIVAAVKAGKGTIGGLLVDPSIYEDIKVLVGNVDRNQVLRAFVRYSIQEDEAKKRDQPPRPQVVPPP